MLYKYSVILTTGQTIDVIADNDYSVIIDRDDRSGTNWQIIGKHRFPLQLVVAILFKGTASV
jgi:hypothetical protein